MSERIPVVVSESQKARWEDFVDYNGEVDTLSDLVRTSVEAYIANAQSDSDMPDEVANRFDEVLEQIEQLNAEISIASETIQSLEKSQIDPDTVEDIVEYYADLVQDEVQELEEEVRSE